MSLTGRVIAVTACPTVVALMGNAAGALSDGRAAGVGAYSTTETVVYDSCEDYVVSFHFDAPPTTVRWTLDSTIVEPDGETRTAFDFGDGASFSGNFDIFLCGANDDIGTYVVSGVLTAGDANYSETTYPMDTLRFTLRAPSSKTTLAISDKSPRLNDVVQFKIKSTGETRFGNTSLEYAYVRLQYKDGGKWKSVKGANKVLTNGAGVWKGKYRMDARRTWKLRAKTLPGEGIYEASQSKVVKVRVG
jgi:hypothetical protein